MLSEVKSIVGAKLVGIDGQLGTISDFYFDDVSWTTRYLVVSSGGFLSKKDVLISPQAVTAFDPELRVLTTSLSKERIEKSPDVETHLPLSRQKEIAHAEYYSVPQYWIGPFTWGPFPYPAQWEGFREKAVEEYERSKLGEPVASPESSSAAAGEGQETVKDIHLRSASEVLGYKVAAEDATFGHVEDMLVATEDWKVRYLVVDTVSWWPSKNVLLSPYFVSSINWEEAVFSFRLSKTAIMDAPQYNKGELTEEFERRYTDYYQKFSKWHVDPSSQPSSL